MNTLVSVLLWIGAISPGAYSESDIVRITSENRVTVALVCYNPMLRRIAENSADASLVVVFPPTDGE